ncbi:MAG: hypothetical protein ACTHMJ_04690 [Thermomicrobiales bacterium]
MVTTQSTPVSVDRRPTSRQPQPRRRLATLFGCMLLGVSLLAGVLLIQTHRPQPSAPASAQPAQAPNWRFLERNQLPEIAGAPAPAAITPLSSQAIRFREQNDLSSLDGAAMPIPATVANWRFQEQNEILPASGEVTPEHGPR